VAENVPSLNQPNKPNSRCGLQEADCHVAASGAELNGWAHSPSFADIAPNRRGRTYTIRDAIWAKAGMKPFDGCLCIGCLEARLGRKLEPRDFLCGHEFNDPCLPGTVRLLERRGRTKG
jgi:hypothetical protein